MTTRLASRFGRNSSCLRSTVPLTEDQMRKVAPSIFAPAPHDSRSERYTYIPTATVLTKLRTEGFQPFVVAQTRVRDESKREFTKHLLRLRHASQINDAEANEIILLNSHDGTSSYQMMAGMLRFVCTNGLVCGDVVGDVRVHHKGDVVENVIQGAFDVLDGFELVREVRDSMRAITLEPAEAEIFARSALALKYEPEETKPAPITEAQLLLPRRSADDKPDLWTTFNRVQENMIRGGLAMRSANGRRQRTRAVQGIDQSVKMNRALWMLAEEMRKLKA
ncbi:DUF932 domain-containing protein [Caenimonas koreensis DSM 17982]|uniref:DUF932 domain-containing protein n=1 Tax=Caenimonas koreensis DSM 17982 TaxID=1121255 RepID=A0A844BCR5_9BURK|nr:DUF932 domain-containing protein [Caenimonas koreensis]MRD49356.1 DUF932 domain-containing protein [Caenimonas koreensis DSM 17982]